MLISHSKKFIFIHIYKVAGTSIANALGKYCFQSPKTRNPVRYIRQKIGFAPNIFVRDFPGHIAALQLKQTLPAEIFDSYFKFAFVRNPWDWQVSLYEFARQTPNHHQHELTKSFGGFDKYLEWRVEKDLKLQKDFVTDRDGRILVDYVGKIENIHDDFRTICQRIGIPNVELPHKNRSQRKNSSSYYTPYLSALIEEHFAEDITLFGYERPF